MNDLLNQLLRVAKMNKLLECTKDFNLYTITLAAKFLPLCTLKGWNSVIFKRNLLSVKLCCL